MLPIAQMKREQENPLTTPAGIPNYFQLGGMGRPVIYRLPAFDAPQVSQFSAKIMIESASCFQRRHPVARAGWEQIPNDNFPAFGLHPEMDIARQNEYAVDQPLGKKADHVQSPSP